MGLFDKLKKKATSEIFVEYNSKLEVYTLEYDNITFEWDEKPPADVMGEIQIIAQNYKAALPNIIGFMLPDLNSFYGNVSAEDIKAKLGKPTIHPDRGEVVYCEQAFDSIHIFSFEFFGDDFTELDNFMIDG